MPSVPTELPCPSQKQVVFKSVVTIQILEGHQNHYHSVLLIQLGNSKPKESDDKRNFLADAMREMESGGKSSSLASAVRRVPNVIRVVMRPEVPPTRRHHRGHRHRHIGGLASVFKLAEGFNKLSVQRPGSRRNKTARLFNTENTLKETVRFLERVNSQLDNMSKPQDQTNKVTKTVKPANITLKGDDEVMVTDSFPLFPELRSIVEHGKPFDPDITRAAFARAKQIVWDSVGQDPTTTSDIGHLNNTKLTNAVALLEMAVREAEKMERNKTTSVDQETNTIKMIPNSSEPNMKVNRSKHDAVQLKILKDLLLEELKQANYTKDKAGILISDIPFQKLRSKEQSSLMQKLSLSTVNSSEETKVNPGKGKPVGDTQALLENYTSFITNILKAAHLSVLKNLTGDSSSSRENNTTNLNRNSQSQSQQSNTQEQSAQRISPQQSSAAQHLSPVKEQQNGQHLSFANAAQEQQQQQQKQHLQPVILSKERLAARRAFGTAQKLVKAFLARQELYKAENEFFNKIHEMLNKTTPNGPLTAGQASDAKESKITSQPTAASPIRSPLSQSPINTASSPSIGEGDNQKQTSEAQKKFEEAAHLEEKVAAQQDEMYDALMGHTIGTVKGGGDGAFDEEGAIRETPEQDGVEDSYNTEDYGDFKDSDEEAEKKFYHDHSQGDFEANTVGESSLSLRSRISSVNSEQSGSTESSGIAITASRKDKTFNNKNFYSTNETSGDNSGDDNTGEKQSNMHLEANSLRTKSHKTLRKIVKPLNQSRERKRKADYKN